MNIWSFTGNLGKDSEIRHLPSGEPICTFSVAVKSGYGDKQKTTWANCAIFGKQASSALPDYLTQGTQVAISGEVCLEEWENNGVKNKALKVNVLKIDLIGSSQGKNAPQSQTKHSAPQLTNTHNEPRRPPPAGFDDDFEDSIPF
jgi:single-strand DNA-binding protein